MTDTTEPQPVRKSSLPCTPPPEFEFHTWFPLPDGGGDLVPGQRDRGVHVRRLVTYGDWEPVRPDRWADEPESAAAASVVVPAADRATLRNRIAEALWATAEHNVIAEWICCDPIDPKHGLCSQGDAALRMLKALIVDDPEAWKPAPLPDAVLSVLPAPADRTAVLTEAADALDLFLARNPPAAASSIGWRGAWAWLRERAAGSAVVDRVAAETPPAETERCVHCGQPVRRITGTLAAWWVHVPGGNTVCHPQHAAASTRATPGPAVVAQPGKDTETPQPFIPHAHYRRDDGVDCCVHTIPVGPDSCRECRELADEEA